MIDKHHPNGCPENNIAFDPLKVIMCFYEEILIKTWEKCDIYNKLNSDSNLISF